MKTSPEHEESHEFRFEHIKLDLPAGHYKLWDGHLLSCLLNTLALSTDNGILFFIFFFFFLDCRIILHLYVVLGQDGMWP